MQQPEGAKPKGSRTRTPPRELSKGRGGKTTPPRPVAGDGGGGGGGDGSFANASKATTPLASLSFAERKRVREEEEKAAAEAAAELAAVSEKEKQEAIGAEAVDEKTLARRVSTVTRLRRMEAEL